MGLVKSYTQLEKLVLECTEFEYDLIDNDEVLIKFHHPELDKQEQGVDVLTNLGIYTIEELFINDAHVDGTSHLVDLLLNYPENLQITIIDY